jgi:prolyl-tRNA synthetase
VGRWLDLRAVEEGEPCPNCGEPLAIFKAIEIGHIFKLGRFFAETLGLEVLDEEGNSRVVTMGSYGIGLERNMAAVVEAHHDEKGISWPVSVAPYEVVVTVLRAGDGPTSEAGERIYGELRAAGIDVLLDDRDERPGVKFNDADLIGIPYRVTIGPRGLEGGMVELVRRRDGDTGEHPVGEVAATVAAIVRSERR